jgi:hypothetical protein
MHGEHSLAAFRPTRLAVAACFISVALAQGCAGTDSAGESSRYPEKKRPEPARSASDGEILGANRQAPDDTLEASVTNEHGAAGWAEEDDGVPPPVPVVEGKERLSPPVGKVPSRDSQLKPPDCIPLGARPTSEPAGEVRKPVCPPSPSQ